jgi:uncharacterized membrane protein
MDLLFNQLQNLPLVGGALLLTQDRDDPRHQLFLICAGLMVLLLAISSFGVETGATGHAIISAFTLIIGYFFGQKELEIKQLKLGGKCRK